MSSAGAGSFGKPVTIARAPHGIVYDKPWIACDGHRRSRYFGRCYAVWDELGLRDGPRGVVLASTSKDGGSHWGPPVRTADRTRGFGGVPLVRPDGSIVVVYPNTEHPLRPRIEAFASTDGGASWGPSITIAVPRRLDVQRAVRDPGLPSVAIDGAGSFDVAWSDCRFEPACAVDDIVLSRSPDARSWSLPILVAEGTPSKSGSLVTPALAVRRRGSRVRIGLLYYTTAGNRCGLFRPAACTITVDYTSSRDGGNSWSSPTQIGWPMRANWFPRRDRATCGATTSPPRSWGTGEPCPSCRSLSDPAASWTSRCTRPGGVCRSEPDPG